MNHRATPRHRRTATLAAALTVPLACLVLTGCAGVNRALDCAETAATVAGDIQDLQNAATNIGQVTDGSRRQATVSALDNVRADLKDLGGRTSDSDVTQAVADLDAAVRDARTSAAGGATPDLDPLVSAAARLTGVCTPG
jgi:hypothetical protein